jgi:hypothetical protein
MSDSSSAASGTPRRIPLRWLRRSLARNRRYQLISVVPPPAYALSIAVARRRQADIERFLGLPDRGSGDYVPPLHVFEPPSMQSTFSRLGFPTPDREFDFGAACGQYARLRRQLNEDPLLLLDGVIDLVVRLRELDSGMLQHVARDLGRPFFWETTELGRLVPPVDIDEFCAELSLRFPELCELPVSTNIGVTYIDEAARNHLSYPFKVIIETNDFRLLYALIVISNHVYYELGIGIDWRPQVSNPSSFFQCAQLALTKPGERGTVGGRFDVWLNHSRTPDMPTYAVTCAHVLDEGCAAIKVVSWPHDKSEEPDAALLEIKGCPCLQVAQADRPLTTGPNLTASADAHLITALAAPANSRRRGYVYGPTWYYELDRMWSRFPAAKILPLQSRLAWALSGILSPMFALPGDSGAWVVVADQRAPFGVGDVWIGMVVGGDKRIHTSYVTDGASLKYYFEAKLTKEFGKAVSLRPRGG